MYAFSLESKFDIMKPQAYAKFSLMDMQVSPHEKSPP